MTMQTINHRSTAAIVLTVALLGSAIGSTRLFAFSPQQEESKQKTSKFGEYEGYSEPSFQKWVTSSRYLEMRDGVKLAIDVVRPSIDGENPVDEPFPVIWTHSRYHRNPQAMAPTVKSMVDSRPDLQRLIRHGYVVASVGVRGSGASFGRFDGLFSPAETRDSYEIIEWLSTQPWCDGNVGMFGGSYLGMTQYMAASQNHPALKAIFPDVAGFDLYDVMYPGGVFRADLIGHWDNLTRMLDTQLKAPKVTSDQTGELLKQAIAEHKDNWEVLKGYADVPFRDSQQDGPFWTVFNPAPSLSKINEARVPAYHWNGLLDVFSTDAAIWYANYDGPQKLCFGAWPHSVMHDTRFIEERMRLTAIEEHRWFDYWLKGIDNGIAEEPPVHYAVLVDPQEWTWRSANNWPPKTSRTCDFYFSQNSSGSIDSVNDGTLTRETPKTSDGADAYAIDLTTTTGTTSRWDNAVGQGGLKYADMSDNDRKCLTYTSEKLTEDLTITGHPIATLYLSASVEDCNLHVLLEEVDEQGYSHYVSEGLIKAALHVESMPPWNNLGLPYQRCFKEDYQPLKEGEVNKIRLDLHPVAVVVNQNHRIRISIMCADQDNAKGVEKSHGGKVQIQCNQIHPSGISLPIETNDAE